MYKKIFISTGEVSGDLHGSLLANALFNEAKKRSLNLDVYGLGGERMRKEGVKIFVKSPLGGFSNDPRRRYKIS